MKRLTTILVVLGILLFPITTGGPLALAQERGKALAAPGQRLVTFVEGPGDPIRFDENELTVTRASAQRDSDPIALAYPKAVNYPLRLTDAPPTVALTPTLGYSGQSVTAAGQAPAGSSGVRVVWRYAGATRSAAVVTPDASGFFQAQLLVPHDAPAGPAEVCAAITGVERAAFGCAPFTILPAPPGAVEGRLPAGVEYTAGEVLFLLLNRAGVTLHETPVTPDGSFRVEDVAPGIYKTAIVGVVAPTVWTDKVVVRPAQTTTVAVRVAPTTGSCSNKLVVTQVSLSPSANHASAAELSTVGLAEFPPPARASSNYDFGVYIAGVSLQATLNVSTQGKPDGLFSSEKPPIYRFISPDGQTGPSGTMSSTGKSQQWQAQVDLGQMTTAGIWELHVIPQDSSHGGDHYCKTVNHARFIDDPMKVSFLFRPADSATMWNSIQRRYEFHGKMPNPQKLVGVTLPLRYPKDDWNLPMLGKANSEFDAYLYMQGTMTLDCTMTFTAFSAQAQARLLGQSVLNKSWSPLYSPSVTFNPDDLKATAIAFNNILLWKKDWSTQVYQGVVASYWGIVTVNAAVAMGLHGEVVMNITLYPLVPATDIRLVPTITPSLTIRIWVDLLLGVASAGADATGSASLSMPFHVKNRDLLNPFQALDVWFEDPCVGVRVDLSVWARVNLKFWKKTWNIGQVKLIDQNSCGKPNPAPQSPPPPPKLLGAPAIAASPDGGMLVVFVGDADPSGQSPKPKIYALYKAPGASGWPDPSHAVALTDGTMMVQDPTVAFAFDPPWAFVFWTQTNISASDEDKAGDDINKILDRQDIYMSVGNPLNNVWSPPLPMTNDPSNNLRSDGRPAAAGDDLGVTLAWVRAIASPYERRYTRIAMRNLDSTGWGPMRLIQDDQNGMHAQPSVARAHFWDRFNSQWRAVRYVAYTANADLSSWGPRRIRVWFQDGWSRDSDLVDWTRSELPDNAMSPAVGIDYQGYPMLAYLLGTTDPQGAPPADPTAFLYFAWYSGYRWHPTQVTHNCGFCDNSPIKAEKPTWTWRSNGKSAELIFREFGEAGTDAQVGHIAHVYILYSEFRDPTFSYMGWFPQGPGPNWQAAAAMNQQSHDLDVCWLESAPQSVEEAAGLAQLRPAAPAARVAVTSVILDTSAEMLKMVNVPLQGDPALDPALLIEPRHAAVGETVTITATVRNLGREPVSGLTVSLYHDDDGMITPVGMETITFTLAPGDAVQVAWDVVADNGQQFYYAVVAGGGSDMGDLNNDAHGTLNALGQPRILTIVPSQRFANALEIGWEMEGQTAIAGYRILRAASPTGPYELVGETNDVTFVDLGLNSGVPYFYKVQAFDADGILSPASGLATGSLTPHRLHLPLIVSD